MKHASCACVPCVLAILFLAAQASALEMEKLKVQRKEIFEFTEKPKVTREGDKITITFTSKDLCDATVAIENAEGRIIRHLASGVLGKNAPAPFQKNSLKQTVVWDGKDEIGRYIDDKDSHTVRVSLGLKAQMERTLFWSPKRLGGVSAIPAAAPEGVYVAESYMLDHGNWGGMNLRLFDHQGNYVRTVYPFPRDKIEEVQGLKWLEFPPDRERLPSKLDSYGQDTLLLAQGFRLMAVRGNRICLVGEKRLVRLATDGTSGGVPHLGPRTSIPRTKEIGEKPPEQWGEFVWSSDLRRTGDFYKPADCALSPDGKWLYLTGYHRHTTWLWPFTFLHGVARMAVDGDQPPERFLGVLEDKGFGSDNEHFSLPASVDCDDKGRVYVADNLNNRIQVFAPDGRYLKTIPVERPGLVRVDRVKGDIFVFTWEIGHANPEVRGESKDPKPTLVHLGPMEDPKVVATYPSGMGVGGHWAPSMVSAAADAYSPDRRIWMAGNPLESSVYGVFSSRDAANIEVVSEQDGKLVGTASFHKDALQALVRPRAWKWQRPRMAVNPATGLLYLGLMIWDTATMGVSFHEVVVVNPETGKIKAQELPTDPEDMGFDWEGRVYLRAFDAVTRFNPNTWREVPYDYGEERTVCHGSGGSAKPYKAISALMLPSGGQGGLHLGGLGVAPDGTVVVSCINPNDPAEKTRMKEMKEKNITAEVGGKPYTPPIYPGRYMGQEVHVFDRHGHLLKADAAPGIGGCNDVEIDRGGNVYLLAASTPYLDGKPYFNGRGCTLVKVVPGKMKAMTPTSLALIPLAEAQGLKRPLDMTRPGLWVEGAEWLFGPVGADGHYGSGGRCHCFVHGWFALDYFGRSFAPEVDRFRVVVLDTNGNVILRIGKYGNVDDGVPLVKPNPALADKQGGQPPTPRSIGGDEVAIMHCMNLTVHTDRRLFLADIGNQCIRSVKLDYHAEESVPLKGVADHAGK